MQNEAVARREMERFWQPNPVWADFIGLVAKKP
jgi:hypothetical protein